MTGTWLEDTRASYDTVAASYAEFVRGTPDGGDGPALARFADAVTGGAGGPVADVGCGPGHVTAYLAGLGLDARGVDLSPVMIELARREHPALRFEVASMTSLGLPDASLGGVLAWYSLIHVPEAELAGVLAGFARALRPGGVVLAGFHVGDRVNAKTRGYGGHPMKVDVHLRPLDRMADQFTAAGLVVEALITRDPDADVPQGRLLARRPLDGA